MEKEPFLFALENIRKATAVIGNKHSINIKSLFDSDQEADVRFNGYKSVTDYRDYLKGLYRLVKDHFTEHYPPGITNPNYQEVHTVFADCLFQVAETRRLIFKSDKEPLFDRIEVSKLYNLEPRMEPLVKKKFCPIWKNSGNTWMI
jgi:hypothetical protein